MKRYPIARSTLAPNAKKRVASPTQQFRANPVVASAAPRAVPSAFPAVRAPATTVRRGMSVSVPAKSYPVVGGKIGGCGCSQPAPLPLPPQPGRLAPLESRFTIDPSECACGVNRYNLEITDEELQCINDVIDEVNSLPDFSSGGRYAVPDPGEFGDPLSFDMLGKLNARDAEWGYQFEDRLVRCFPAGMISHFNALWAAAESGLWRHRRVGRDDSPFYTIPYYGGQNVEDKRPDAPGSWLDVWMCRLCTPLPRDVAINYDPPRLPLRV